MRAVYTAKFAGDPDRVCTFTPHCSGSNLKASKARFCRKGLNFNQNFGKFLYTKVILP